MRRKGDEATVLGGMVPTAGDLPLMDAEGNPYWRLVVAPAGGRLFGVLGRSILANVDDCWHPAESCAGLPMSMWPPLESEVNGQPADRPYEMAWAHYLQLASEAASEADALGTSLLEQGLALDNRIEEATSEVIDLCGADSNGKTGCGDGNPEMVSWATLGDKQACLWKVDGELCACPVDDKPCPVRCPLSLPDDVPNQADESGLEKRCSETLQAQLLGKPMKQGTQVVPVFNTMGLAPSTSFKQPTACAAFDRLRNGDFATQAERERFIVEELAPAWPKDRVRQIMQLLRYKEAFFDNWTLEYDGHLVFQTERPYRPCENKAAMSPCNPVKDDQRSGSRFWETPIRCFVEQDCNDPRQDVGLDGCPDQHPVRDQLSMDTEPEAQRTRWAWGFGHLRRSVATLGVLTGALSGRMHLARVCSASSYHWEYSPSPGELPQSMMIRGPGIGRCTHDIEGSEPPWVQRCMPFDIADHANTARCVKSGGRAGSSPLFGYPLNANGFLRNGVPTESHLDFPLMPPCWGDVASCVQFPAQGLDPQFMYCDMPSPDELSTNPSGPWGSADAIWAVPGGDGQISSGMIGSSFTNEANFKDGAADYLSALDQIWTMPKAGLCANAGQYASDPRLSAVWRAFCVKPKDLSIEELESQPAFMRFGVVEPDSVEYYSGATIAQWLLPVPQYGYHEQMLFDQRNETILTGAPPFQYPLTARNIVDAMELGCHASNTTAGSSLDCRTTPADKLSASVTSVEQISGVLQCFSSWMQELAGQIVVGPVPREVVEAAKAHRPLSTTSGLGGSYLEAMSAQYDALVAISSDFDHMRDRLDALSLHMRTMASIDRQEDALKAQAHAQRLAAMLTATAQAMSAMANCTSLGVGSVGSAVTSAAAAGLYLESAAAQTKAIEAGLEASKEELEQHRLSVLGAILSELQQARDTAQTLGSHINALTEAAARLEQTRLKAQRASARMNLQDFVNNEPMHVNTVLRRTYNTTLIRYERALARAKKLAFIARRAIELRFGVDLTRMASDMTLVEAPQKWVNDVCRMRGIDYAAIRTADPDAAVERFAFGEAPPEGDDFADAYVGDYVKKLQDFVTSYPIDYPLHDGDDVAVLSLADDIYRITGQCVQPSRNLLYYSTELDQRTSLVVEPETRGWYVTGCGHLAGDDEWTGCVEASRVAGPASLDDELGNSTTQEPISLAGLPWGAIAYRVRNRPCTAGTLAEDGGVATDEQTKPACPDVEQYLAAGAVAQRIRDIAVGWHRVSLYARVDPNGSTLPYENGNSAEMRVVDETTGEVVVAEAVAPSDVWQRFEAAFLAKAGATYRLEIAPSVQPIALVPTDGGATLAPGLLVSAVQVEASVQQPDSAVAPAGAWEKTDSQRQAPQPVCHERSGPQLRARFQRKCDLYLCSDGIRTDCPASDGTAVPKLCYHEATFSIPLDQIEHGELIPSGQIAVGNFNFRHNEVGVNVVGTAVTSCDNVQGASCYDNGFVEYTLSHGGDTAIRNWEGGSLPVHMDRGVIEHGKALAAERIMTNPPSSVDTSLMSPYMKNELKGRPIEGQYTLRIWDSPSLQWDHVEDIQLVWKYHYWTRFE